MSITIIVQIKTRTIAAHIGLRGQIVEFSHYWHYSEWANIRPVEFIMVQIIIIATSFFMSLYLTKELRPS